jgi:hypothetical protein
MTLPEKTAKSRLRAIFSFRLFLLGLLLSIILLICLSPGSSVNAETPEQQASTFAPVLHFTQGEKFYPTSVDYIIGNSVLKQRFSDGSNTTVGAAPTPSSLGTYTGTDLFLDNKLGTLDAIAADYASKACSIGYYAYVHIVSSGSSTVIQYWLFYAYNNGPLNDHQGDIEVVEIFLDNSGAPMKALYSQHGAGENAAWGDVEKTDNHPVVYVAQGSHANYFRYYQGKIGIENDVVGSNGITIMPSGLHLVIIDGNHPSWLNFKGRWGYWGTDEDVALGRAGPLGPVKNQNGVRWADPESYFNSTFSVGGTYFILAWLVANFLLLFVIYVAIRAAWKIVGIARLQRKGGLLVKKFLKGRGSVGLALGIVAILIMVIALFLPWYTITASSQTGPLAKQGGVTLMAIDGINGMQVNLFLGAGGDSTSGYSSLFFMQIPFAILIAVGVVLLVLDVIGVKSGKNIGRKFMFGAITSLLPFILIFLFMTQLPTFLPWASALVPGQTMPPQLGTIVNAIAGNPVYGTTSAQFDVIGTTAVNWGFGIGAYLFLVAAVIRIAAGFIMRSAPELEQKTVPPPPEAKPTSPPPPSQEPQQK